jgi:hypothetical protein
MPSGLATTAATTTTTGIPGNIPMASRHHGSNSYSNGGAGSTYNNDLNFDPLPQQPQQQHLPVVNQHVHQHQHVHHHHHHHLSQPLEKSHRHYRKHHCLVHNSTTSSSTIHPSSSYSQSANIFAPPQPVSSLDQHAARPKKKETPPPKPEPWMEDLRITISGVSLEPMNGFQVIAKLQERSTEVLTRYLPCVHFLVQCQQDLRKGLAAATQKRMVHHNMRDAMTPRQFFASYISNLPKRFYQENCRIMSTENLSAAFKELQKLCASAKAAESQGCEVVKNTFLGGMKDGESWGLRKWLSKQGGALYICNDTECLLNSCQKLDRSKDTTVQLAARLRPLAQNALNKLKNDVPSSYQEHSSAHPYLPFFHRLESALRGMSNFDPEDDDVICIDDDSEVEELKSEKAPPPPNKRKSDSSKASSHKPNQKASDVIKNLDDGSQGVGDVDGGILDVDGDSDIEILDAKPPARKRAKAGSPVGGPAALLAAVAGDDSDYMKDLLSTFDDDHIADFEGFDKKSSLDNAFPMEKDAYDLASGIDQLARLFESNQQSIVRPDYVVADSFWDDGARYAKILRMFSDMLRDPDTSIHFLDSITEDQLMQEGKPSYSSIIKHPLVFRDIVDALLEDFSSANNTVSGNSGGLSETTLSSWNMYNGKELLQAIDLVLLNFLAYQKASDGGGKSSSRSLTNKLRKKLWAFIKQIIDDEATDDEERKDHTPTRRGEGSGFVVHKTSRS